MPERVTEVTTFKQVMPNRLAGALEVTLVDAEGPFRLDIPLSILGPLTFGLFAMAPKIAPPDGLPAAMVLNLNSARPFALEDGRVGLELSVENDVRLPVLFPESAIQSVRAALDALERLRQSPPQPPTAN